MINFYSHSGFDCFERKDMDSLPRKHQFLGFVVILLIVGFLNYFRRIVNGYKFTKYGKILYLVTMITFVVGIMFVLYFTELNNILSFLIGLSVTTLSEHIAKLFITVGDNFNPIASKVINKYTGLDLSIDLVHQEKTDKTNKTNKIDDDANQKINTQNHE